MAPLPCPKLLVSCSYCSSFRSLSSSMAPSALSMLSLRFWAADHPTVSTFRWDHGSWGSSWTFLAFSIMFYLLLISSLRLLLVFRKSPIPLGPLPAAYNFILVLGSLCMFVGCWQAAAVEIEETRWIWRRSKTVSEWILCFPLGTRPAGRVFFWSYVFYISKYYEFLDAVILTLKKQPVACGHVFRYAAVVIMCFLWLTFSQSSQILALLVNTGFNVVMHIYSVLWSLGLVPRWADIVRHLRIAQYVLMSMASFGLIRLHFKKEGCSGFGAWLFNAIMQAMFLPLLLKYNTTSGAMIATSMTQTQYGCKST